MSAPPVSTRRQRLAAQAHQHPARRFPTLAHRLAVALRREADHQTRRDGAPGVAGGIAEEYAADREATLADWPTRRRSGRYEAPPVKRAYGPKADGGQRPLGMPTFADKSGQRAAAVRRGAIDEQDFHDCSYGFRAGRSPHQARPVVRERGMPEHMGGIVAAEVRACVDSLGHDLLCAGLRPRVNDGAILRLIRKWLRAGVREGATRSDPERGSPQGGVGSPLRANLVLDHVLEEGFEREVQPRMHGRGFLLRVAEDGVIGCARADEARRILGGLPKRFARFQLPMHPQKPRLVRVQAPRHEDEGECGDGPFDVLGLTHDWATSRRGDWGIKRRPAKKRWRRARRAVWQWCRPPRHDPLREQYRQRRAQRRGHYQYYGSRGTDRQLDAFHRGVERAWR